MNAKTATFPLVAVDIGNARIKVGFFDAAASGDIPEELPLPRTVLRLSGRSPELGRLAKWIEEISAESTRPLRWWIGSVNRPAATCLVDWLRDNRPGDSLTLLSAADLPLKVDLELPDQVGVDRLIDAVAANRLRDAHRAAVVVDVGTAITVDLVSAEGVFLGGAILPGIDMAARAMHEFTDLLPLVEMSDLSEPPPAVGAATESAIAGGLFWGAVGSIRELVRRMANDSSRPPRVILTGGAGPAVAGLLGDDAVHVPQLTLAGIAISAWSRYSK